jgi:hypothetical protein
MIDEPCSQGAQRRSSMKKVLGTLMALGVFASALGGCAYGDMAAVGTDKVVVMRQDSFLMGALRKAFVCKITDSGLASCAAAESP